MIAEIDLFTKKIHVCTYSPTDVPAGYFLYNHVVFVKKYFTFLLDILHF